MINAETIADLKNVAACSELPDDHLRWILERCEYREFEDGSVVAKYGDPAESMWFLLEGKVNFYMNVNGRQVYYYTFENDTNTGGVGGLLPYSRMKTFPGFSYAMGTVKTLWLNKKYFQELEQLNPDFNQRLIGYMTERARAFATTQLQHEKVNALGKLAAGIAHELNNPAAAINSISQELIKKLTRNFELTEQMLQSKVGPQQIQVIHALVQKKEKESVQTGELSTMQRMDREEEISDWLEENKVSNHREAAETFSEFGFTTDEFDHICQSSGKEAFINAIEWLANILNSKLIIKDLEDASSRISHLVQAIKSHVQMDRTEDMQSTDLARDIENTITLLGFKIREKNITVNRKYCDNMPMVPAYIGELNQVWTNIIDNAIFALVKNGVLNIETTCDAKNVHIFIVDNGAGIPKDIISRIFDPFFTTKKVGEGTGIGLDIVNRIIKHHNGEIKVRSEPGRTEFEICLPLV